ncbi:ABC transporter ATP-binding protein [Geminicoccaceae bacterium 1502E]|nr:ABC transporter ATP-binding protein [Geminicoccaceae bacterium 1502E]
MTGSPALEVRDLSINYGSGPAPIRALRSVDLLIRPGQAVGVVGESGSGKSTLAMAVMGLLPGAASLGGGTVRIGGTDLYAMPPDERRELRGSKISMVFQDPFTSLNPAIPIGRQVAEPLVFHKQLAPAAALREAEALLAEVGIHQPARVATAYPHQLSGGMKQRAMIATALACDPDLLVLDEPTTALDVTVEAQIIDMLEGLRERRGMAIMFISHNLGVIARAVDEVCVLYAGEVVEHGPKETVLHRPGHPYTKGLLASIPRIAERERRLEPIPGRLPDLGAVGRGCIFAARCPWMVERCRREPQPLVPVEAGSARCWRTDEIRDRPWSVPDTTPAARIATDRIVADGAVVVEARDIVKRFGLGLRLERVAAGAAGGLPFRLKRDAVRAVDGVSLTVRAGETVGLVGESGCGKSTLGRCLVRLIDPSGGAVEIAGSDLLRAGGSRRRELARTAQMIFQNPDSSLNPRRTIAQALGRSLKLAEPSPAAATRARIAELLEMVQLPASYAARYPHELSGGEKQRVGIARALATRPRFIVCDEAVSALDVSVQASILNLLAGLQRELGIGYLFISHDLSVVAHIAHRICVMYRGAIIESGPTDQVLEPPYHPYTEALLSAVPKLDPAAGAGQRIRLSGAVDALTDAGAGCRFADRCPRSLGAACSTAAPPLRDAGAGHTLACHLPMDELAARAPIFPRTDSPLAARGELV